MTSIRRAVARVLIGLSVILVAIGAGTIYALRGWILIAPSVTNREVNWESVHHYLDGVELLLKWGASPLLLAVVMLGVVHVLRSAGDRSAD
jgi:hypothetical protein